MACHGLRFYKDGANTRGRGGRGGLAGKTRCLPPCSCQKPRRPPMASHRKRAWDKRHVRRPDLQGRAPCPARHSSTPGDLIAHGWCACHKWRVARQALAVGANRQVRQTVMQSLVR